MEGLLTEKKNGNSILVNVQDVVFGGDYPVIISGPCAIESYDILSEICKKLKKSGANILRGGAFKPRTSPYDFQGLGKEGLAILKAVGQENKMPVVTEVMDPRELNEAIEYADMIQVGSRNMYNYTLLKEIGKSKVPVLLKRGMSATINEWLCAAEYIFSAGNENVVLCERGIRTFEDYTRNTLDLNAVAIIKRNYRLPIIVDPSHGTGLSELVHSMCLASIAAGADGIMVESHIRPKESISDSRQTVTVDEVEKIIKDINKLHCLKG